MNEIPESQGSPRGLESEVAKWQNRVTPILCELKPATSMVVQSMEGKTSASIAMPKHLFLFLLLVLTAHAEPLVTPFKQPANFPVSFRLLLPEHAAIVSHEPGDRMDTITAHLSDDREEGMVVEAIDATGKRVWRRDLGYNMSAAPGCSVSISFHPQVNAVIVSFEGYRSDHSHTLLFVDKTPSALVIREYAKAAPEIASFLKKLPEYKDSYKYWIFPREFTGHQVVFGCIPLELPERKDPHPFAQELQWVDITASIDKDFKITPMNAKRSH